MQPSAFRGSGPNPKFPNSQALEPKPIFDTLCFLPSPKNTNLEILKPLSMLCANSDKNLIGGSKRRDSFCSFPSHVSFRSETKIWGHRASSRLLCVDSFQSHREAARSPSRRWQRCTKRRAPPCSRSSQLLKEKTKDIFKFLERIDLIGFPISGGQSHAFRRTRHCLIHKARSTARKNGASGIPSEAADPLKNQVRLPAGFREKGWRSRFKA